MTSPFSLFFLISCLLAPKLSSATDTITATQPLKDPSSLVSSNGVFKLGFITPQGSTNRYLGIWYNRVSQDIIWVANRDKPLTGSSGALSIASNGALELVNGENQTVWSWTPSSSTSTASAQLLDSGRLAVGGSDVWPSYDPPSDSFLPNTLFSYPTASNSNGTFMQSWKSNLDASEGRYSVGINSISVPQIVISEAGNNQPRWRSGPWNGNSFVGIQDNINSGDGTTKGFILATDKRTYVSLSFNISGGSANSFLANYKLTDQGILVLQRWDDGKKDWEAAWQAPQSKCDAYGLCGIYASCRPQSSPPICRCLKGFDPKNKVEWDNGNWTGGCIRRTKLQQCGGSNGTVSGGGDGFWTLNSVKVPDNADWLLGLNSDECKSQCLNNCTCYAYVYDTGAGCLSWSKDLIDTVEISDGSGMALNIRLAASDLQQRTSSKVKIIGAVAGVLGMLVLALFIFLLWRRMPRKGVEAKTTHTNVFQGRTDVELEELPLFTLEKLVTATNDFDMRNKLGQGGFGPVYKGTLEDGHVIAVKRLSRASGQGLHEFMNEVGLISKLQHRNLVRLLGCCVEAEENMLVYEYMPNKSLDAFLFDPQKRQLLDWTKRLSIIQGICRGLLYLHRDSRLKIIHRDLKASNILLDENLNPKISDFGMARIFGGNQDQENTNRVVGTFGYMAPEYAMEGKFSEKSDVFSFGVLMLEIVSGRKNTSFSLDERSLSLIAHAWNLWNEQNVASLIDPSIVDTCYLGEILKCIQVGLLCVQEFAKDRPSISKLMFFLGSEMADIPSPMPPGFVLRQMQVYSTSGEGSSSQQSQQQQSSSCSVYGDDASITVLVGR